MLKSSRCHELAAAANLLVASSNNEMDATTKAAEKLALELAAFRTATRRVEQAQEELLACLAKTSARESAWLEEQRRLQHELATLRGQIVPTAGNDETAGAPLPAQVQVDAGERSYSPVASVSVSSASTKSDSHDLPINTETTDANEPTASTETCGIETGATAAPMESIAAILSESSSALTQTKDVATTVPPSGILVLTGEGVECQELLDFCRSDTGESPRPPKRSRRSTERNRAAHNDPTDDAMLMEESSSKPNEAAEIVETVAPARSYKQRGAKDYALAAMIWSGSVFGSEPSTTLRTAEKTVVCPNHALYGKGFCQFWRDIQGRFRSSYGVIRSRQETPGKRSLYEVEYDTQPMDEITDASCHTQRPAHVALVSETLAWSGYQTYIRQVGGGGSKPSATDVPFHVVWLQPTLWLVDSEQRLIIEIRGFQLVFTVVPSSIVGAGLGLSLVVFERTLESRTYFVLKAGEMLGLGRYAPLSDTDGKSDLIFLLKNFIHKFEPSEYAFQAKRSCCEVFDLTNDKTGKLHEKAEVSHLIRVNETDGIELPSVTAEYDPSGGIQYNLGHDERHQGDLKITVGEPFELKVDYGDAYETNRVMQNYTRVKGKKLEAMQKSLDDRERTALAQLAVCEAVDVVDCVSFLERLFDPTWNTTAVKLQRALVLALTLRNRVETIKKEGSKDDVARFETQNIIYRVRGVIRLICMEMGGVPQLKDAISSMTMLKDAFVDCIGCLSQDDLASTDFTSFLATLWTNPESRTS